VKWYGVLVVGFSTDVGEASVWLSVDDFVAESSSLNVLRLGGRASPALWSASMVEDLVLVGALGCPIEGLMSRSGVRGGEIGRATSSACFVVLVISRLANVEVDSSGRERNHNN